VFRLLHNPPRSRHCGQVWPAVQLSAVPFLIGPMHHVKGLELMQLQLFIYAIACICTTASITVVVWF
jgi:hypothetical protein